MITLSCRNSHVSYYFIQSSRLSSGHLCGACGDYNGDVVRELTGPRQQLYKNAQQMALSYVVPSQQCNVDSLRSQLDLPEGICKFFYPIVELFKWREFCDLWPKKAHNG